MIKFYLQLSLSLVLILTLLVGLSPAQQLDLNKNLNKEMSLSAIDLAALEKYPADKEIDLDPKLLEQRTAEIASVRTAEAAPSRSQTTEPKPVVTAPKTTTAKPAATVPKTTTTAPKTTTVSPAPASNNKATAVIATAKQYIGVKYQWGGTTPSGFDCSGYLKYVFAKHGITLPRVSRDQYTVGTPVALNALQPGDLVFFSMDGDKVIDHVGMFIGQGQFIHASSSKGVAIDNLSTFWKSKYIGAKRVL